MVRHREPGALPAEFTASARSTDVDGDGRDDRVIPWPDLGRIGELRADLGTVPVAVVAHRLAEPDRFAVDDDVARAALRAVCPAKPDGTVAHRSESETPPDPERVAHAEALFLEGFCRRVWGASSDEAVEGVRASARAAARGIFDDNTVDRVAAAVRTFPVVQELDARDVPALDLVPDAPDSTQAEPSPIATPPVDPRCVPVLRANTAVYARAEALARSVAVEDQGAPRVLGEGVLPCVATAQGVWSLQLRGATAERGVDPVVRIRGELVWRPARGPAVRAQSPITLTFAPLRSDLPSIVSAGDYNGDGVPEALLRIDTNVVEDEGSTAFTVYTVEGARVVPWAPAAAFTRDAIDTADPDHDGLLDFVRRSPWHTVDVCGLAGIAHAGPSWLVHVTAGGASSTDDAVVRAWVMDHCRREGPRNGPAHADVIDVACARLRGLSADDTVAALARRWPDAPTVYIPPLHDSPVCLSFSQVASLALHTPAFTVPR